MRWEDYTWNGSGSKREESTQSHKQNLVLFNQLGEGIMVIATALILMFTIGTGQWSDNNNFQQLHSEVAELRYQVMTIEDTINCEHCKGVKRNGK